MKRLFSSWSALLFLALLAGPTFGVDTGAISATELIQRGHADLASNRWNAAESSFRLAVETEPTNATAYAGWGYTLAHLNRRQEASGAYEKALELNPQRTNTWLYLGEVYSSLGRFKRA